MMQSAPLLVDTVDPQTDSVTYLLPPAANWANRLLVVKAVSAGTLVVDATVPVDLPEGAITSVSGGAPFACVAVVSTGGRWLLLWQV